MSHGKVIVFGVARPGFDTETALRNYQATIAFLEQSGYEVIHCGDLVTDPDDAEKLALEYRTREACAVIFQHATFTDGRFLTQVCQHIGLPLLLWSIPEARVEGRLGLNSLTGINLAASLLVRMNRNFRYVLGIPGEAKVRTAVIAWLKAAAVAFQLQRSTVAAVGNPPPGFFTSKVDHLQLLNATGIKTVDMDLETLFQRATQIAEDRSQTAIQNISKIVTGVDALLPEQVAKSTQFDLALADWAKEAKVNAVAVRCWPEFFRDYQAAACSGLSHLTEAGIPAACEADMLGAVTMLIQYYLTGECTFLGDMVHIDPEQNSAVYWHCGVCPKPLASVKTGPVAGVQPNRNYGFAYDNGLKGGPVTVARLGYVAGGFRMLIVKGEAIDLPNRFWGASVEVKLESKVREVFDFIIKQGYEHHFSLVWQDVSNELIELCELLQIPYSVF